MNDADELVEAIRSVRSLANSRDLDRLDAALRQLSHVPGAELAMESLFGLFERFPAEDAAGLLSSVEDVLKRLSGDGSEVPPSVRHVAAFWSALHQLETFDGYEIEVVNSLRRAPSEFGLVMLIRLIGGGREAVGGVDLRDLLGELSTATDAPPRVRELARRSIGRRDLL